MPNFELYGWWGGQIISKYISRRDENWSSRDRIPLQCQKWHRNDIQTKNIWILAPKKWSHLWKVIFEMLIWICFGRYRVGTRWYKFESTPWKWLIWVVSIMYHCEWVQPRWCCRMENFSLANCTLGYSLYDPNNRVF